MEGLNKESIGWSYEGQEVRAETETIQAYARATSDENPRYLDPAAAGGIVAPPMYSVRLLKEVLFKPLLDPRVHCDLLMLLHGEQDMTFHQLIHPGDLIKTRSEIAEIEDKDAGQILKLKMACLRQDTPIVEATATLFIRARQPKPKQPGKKPAKPAPELPAWTFEDKLTVAADQSLRYAEASLDDNPIHVDEKVAQAAGLRTIILQGLCTMAFCQRTVVNKLADGDPTRLQRLKVRFSKPVYPGDELTVQGALGDQSAERLQAMLRVVNNRGEEVISAGQAEVRR